ncbi:hypothetical protein [Acidovorax sp. GW101-3H11]|uniref:hypothetical protein n=1 Tax=Acidovorax sp. GW101-3H11 TaxID=1813946 RepID=UPI000AA04542|nr:hypothetical protein [Acidovorax sp. GW101-3H11]
MRALFYPPYRPTPRLRPPRTRLACLALLAPLFTPWVAVPTAFAQSPHAAALAAAPGAATAPLIHPAPPTPTALAELPTGQAWQDAHHAVGQFPRGHADIVVWEKRQGTATNPPSSSSSPHQHSGAEAAPGAARKPMPPHHRSHHGDQPMHGGKP